MRNNNELSVLISLEKFYNEFIPTEERAVEYIEHIRWPGNIICPFCQNNKVYKGKNIKRPYKCKDCSARFSVKTDTIMEGSNISIKHWLYIMYVMYINEKKISSLELANKIGISQKTLWSIVSKISE